MNVLDNKDNNKKIREIIRLVLYSFYLPAIILFLYICKLVKAESLMGRLFDLILNLKPDVTKNSDEVFSTGMIFFLFIFLPLDLLLLKVKDDDKWFIIAFSIPVLITTVVLIIGGISVIKNFGDGVTISMIALGWAIHSIMVINMYCVLLDAENTASYMDIGWLYIAFVCRIHWGVILGVSLVIMFILIDGLFSHKTVELASLARDAKRCTCPRCGKKVKGLKRFDDGKEYVFDKAWTSKDTSENVIADCENTNALKRYVFVCWYEYTCDACLHEWVSESWDEELTSEEDFYDRRAVNQIYRFE